MDSIRAAATPAPSPPRSSFRDRFPFRSTCLLGLLSLTAVLAGCSSSVDSQDGLRAGMAYTNEEVGDREDGTGAFRTHCLESHESHDDPLVYPGQPGAAHHHVFFGNPMVDAYTTTASLDEATETTCDGGTLNRSAYWVPAMYDQNGERMEMVEPLFYYKTGYHVPASTIQPLPEGLQMIAGNSMSQEAQGTTAVKFRCASWESDQKWFDPGDPLDHVDTLPDCEVDDILEMRIVFPQCWDGVNLDSPDHMSHMAYPSEATPPAAGTGTCPDSHPIAIPEISYNFAVYVSQDRGRPGSWRFSSDHSHAGSGTAMGGMTFHADWMNGWDPEIMETIVENCLRPAKECMVGLLGDGTRLESVLGD